MKTLIISAAILLTVGAASATPKNEDNVTICHRTDDVSMPYVRITVDPSAIDGEGNNDHSHHTGPVAVSEAIAQALKDNKTKWGDIIPNVLNWSTDGQAVYNNDCKYVAPPEVPPVTPPVTPPVVPPVTPPTTPLTSSTTSTSISETPVPGFTGK